MCPRWSTDRHSPPVWFSSMEENVDKRRAEQREKMRRQVDRHIAILNAMCPEYVAKIEARAAQIKDEPEEVRAARILSAINKREDPGVAFHPFD